jgi:hypothetical protein
VIGCVNRAGEVLQLANGGHLDFQESERPAKHLLDDENVADKISRRLLQPASGKVSEHFSWGLRHSVVCSKAGIVMKF